MSKNKEGSDEGRSDSMGRFNELVGRFRERYRQLMDGIVSGQIPAHLKEFELPYLDSWHQLDPADRADYDRVRAEILELIGARLDEPSETWDERELPANAQLGRDRDLQVRRASYPTESAIEYVRNEVLGEKGIWDNYPYMPDVVRLSSQ